METEGHIGLLCSFRHTLLLFGTSTFPHNHDQQDEIHGSKLGFTGPGIFGCQMHCALLLFLVILCYSTFDLAFSHKWTLRHFGPMRVRYS